jgi:hypothetical protein
MSRRARLAAIALLASFALSTAACTDLTGPRSLGDSPNAEMQGSGT